MITERQWTVILIILLLQLFESSGISLMADSQYNGETRVQVLLEYLQVSHPNIRHHNYRAVCLTNLKHVLGNNILFYLLIVC